MRKEIWQRIKRFLPFIVLTIVVLIYTKPYFQSGFFPTHDGEWAIIRLAEMERELKDFQIPPRWSDYLNHGYGYPLFLYTYPFPYYLAILFRLGGIGYIDSIKILFVLSLFLSSIFMYFLAREIAGSLAGLLAAIFYTVAPFRLVNLYVRGSLGESLSLTFIPLLFYLSIQYIIKPTKLRMIACSTVLAVVILTHNVMALVFFPFWLLFLYVMTVSYSQNIKEYTFKYFSPMILLGLGLSAYFFLPAFWEKKYIILAKIKLTNVSEHFVSLKDFLISPWSYGVKPSFQLGWAHLLSGIVGFFSFLFANKIYRQKYRLLYFYLISCLIILIFFTQQKSSIFWQIPPLSWTDFPWRLMSPLVFFLALSTFFLSIFKITKLVGIILAVVTLTFSLQFAKPISFFDRADSYYFTNDATTTSMDELMPVWAKEVPRNRYEQKVIVEQGKAIIEDLSYNSKKISFTLENQTTVIIKINSIYFPNWQYFVNGKLLVADYSNREGVVKLTIPAGRYTITGYFQRTAIRWLADIISLMSLLVIAIISIKSLLIYKHHE